MDSCIPTFNERDDYGHLKSSIQVIQDDNEEEEEEDAFVEKTPNLPEALEMMRRLHRFASIEQPQLHNLIYDLESQLTDIYLDSKAVKQSSITDFFLNAYFSIVLFVVYENKIMNERLIKIYYQFEYLTTVQVQKTAFYRNI
ncbi:unnamed protein product [Rotaria magnacalcarata]|uniref:Uncharacterized protein n=1 Tax=Rotaria magnacalcarata TaxID=392030 RepID=A0A816SLE2_9BILA|nr:unnamed protein product [Rotaria magnacalcarata]CAF2089428.1 unnamed protein product [Rotaria magnacalcarata]CAF3947417.1 unnamed protein product [Rotaria magnacalcarata]CAF4747056.1 unnamed protein product [Rotaria magnacalcarata]